MLITLETDTRAKYRQEYRCCDKHHLLFFVSNYYYCFLLFSVSVWEQMKSNNTMRMPFITIGER